MGKDDFGYWVHPSAGGLRGENPQQALTTDFTKQGAEVRSHDLRWALETRAYGYGDALRRVKAVAPQAKANRVEYRRDGVTEWYKNGPLGLEQGFTLDQRPGEANGKALTVELALRGDLVAALAPGGKSVEMRRKDGQAALRYTGLQTRDATGRELRSWLEVSRDRLLVRVEDAGARYPLVIDPWIQQAELIASDGAAGDNFGAALAVDGSIAVVGSPGHTVGSNQYQGAVYVFVESGGTWSQQAELIASDGEGGDYFGNSVAVSGSIVVVGADNHTVGSNSGQGAAYVFVQNGATWSQQAELTSSDRGGGDNFGNSVAVSGSTVVVGAANHTVGSNGYHQGAAYVFVQSGTSWSQQTELTSSDGEADDNFGSAVAVSGSTAVVGAPCHLFVGYPQGCGLGAAYVFAGSGGTWNQQAELAGPGEDDDFGSAVAVSGSTAVVGAFHLYSPTQLGAAYVFAQSGGTWSLLGGLAPPGAGLALFFGRYVAINGGTAVVGGFYETSGEASVFAQSGETWSQQAELIPPGWAESDESGPSVAVSGSTILAGVPSQTVGSNQNQGAVYVFGSSGPLYTLSAAPSSLLLVQGEQVTSAITITPWNGFSGSVTLSTSVLPNGVTAVFDPNPATGSSTLTLTASGTATTGIADVLMSGGSNNLEQTIPLTLAVGSPTSDSVSPSALDFVKQAVNTNSVAKTVTLKNTGAATMYFGSIAISLGTNFAISSNTCGTTLNAGKKCTVKITFTPTQLGTLTDTLNFTDTAGGSPQTVALSGTGEAQAALTPATYAFLPTKVGDISYAHKFTLRNNLPTTLTGISYSTTGPFAVSASTCGTTLNSKATCTISMTFTPIQTGAASGTLSVTDSANNSPQTSNLTGTGAVH